MPATALRHLPNVITISRLILVIPIVVSIYERQFELSLLLFVIAGVSDGFDGMVARWGGWVSPFGQLIDPLADKLLLLTTAITLGVLDYFPLMLMYLMIAKDMVIIGGILVCTLLAGFPDIRPILLGKLTTTLQIVFISCIILDLIVQHPWLDAALPVLTWIVACVTVLDGVVYVWLGTSMMAEDARWKDA